MTILDRYIIKEFLLFFFIILLSFIGLFLIIDFFEKVRMFMSNDASFYQVTSFFVFRIPFVISQFIPAAVLLAALITYSSLSRHNEIVAMKANGISLYRTSLPVIIITSIICILAFFISEFITPKANDRADIIKYIEVQKREALGAFKQNQIWYRGTNTIYNFKYFDTDNDILKGITINNFDKNFHLTHRIDAEWAQWKDGAWIFHNVLTTHYVKGDFPVLKWIQSQEINLPEKPTDFKIVQKDADKMGFIELKNYIQKIQAEGFDVSRYLVDMHGKIAFSFVSLILVVIGITFSLKSERSGGIAMSIGVGIFIGFSYWVVYALFLSLGRSGTLPPFLSAWFANIIFSLAALILFLRVKT